MPHHFSGLLTCLFLFAPAQAIASPVTDDSPGTKSTLPDVSTSIDHRFIPDRMIGLGGYKTVFSVRGRPDLAIAIARWPNTSSSDFEREENDLATLRQFGLPVVKVVRQGLTHDGKPAMVLKRYAAGSKNDWDRFARLSNHVTLADAIGIRDRLRRHEITVLDLQFLIASDGHLVIADPQYVVQPDERKRFNAREMDSLIKDTKEAMSGRITPRHRPLNRHPSSAGSWRGSRNGARGKSRGSLAHR